MSGVIVEELIKKMRWTVESDGTARGTVFKDGNGVIQPYVQGFCLEMSGDEAVFKVHLPAPRLVAMLPLPVVFFKDDCPVCGNEASFMVTKQSVAGAKEIEVMCRSCLAKLKYLGWEVIKEK
jgi:hypothetical protein